MFVQDFIRIERPLDTTVDAFERAVVPRLAELVRAAWALDADGQGAAADPAGNGTHEPVDVAITPRRPRPDGVVFTISWPPSDDHPWFPEFDADLEFASLSPGETHLQLSGQSRFPLLEPWSTEDRKASRNCMAAVDRLLAAVATEIGALADGAESPVRSRAAST